MANAESKDPSRKIGQVVGKNLAQLREQHGQTQREAATYLRSRGLGWATANVASIESGRRETIDFGALVLIAGAYDVPLSRLFEGDEEMRLSEQRSVRLAELRSWLGGERSPEDFRVYIIGQAAHRAIKSWRSTPPPANADGELAQRLGLKAREVTEAAKGRWGHTLHQERDRRLAEFGEMTPTQRRTRRGHITRQLAKELEPYLPKPEQDAE